MEYKTVKCIKLNKELRALDKAPFPGPAGQEILEKVSEQAWNEWLNFQTILINENRLNLMEEGAREFLKKQRNKFFFEPGELDMPEQYVDPNKVPDLKS